MATADRAIDRPPTSTPLELSHATTTLRRVGQTVYEFVGVARSSRVQIALWARVRDLSDFVYQELAEEISDLVLVDAALVHASTDNQSSEIRLAANAHVAAAGTADHSVEVLGANPLNDWMAWLRDGNDAACPNDAVLASCRDNGTP